MIAFVRGRLATIGDDGRATIEAGAVAYEVLLAPYLTAALSADRSLGEELVVHTTHVLESPNQGASFVPRLYGFASAEDREVYELLTSVRGLGHRRALRTLVERPAAVAAAIAHADEAALRRLPEIGAKLARTIIEELGEGMRTRLAVRPGPAADASVELRPLPAQAEDAIAALVSLGESPADARRKVQLAAEKAGEAADSGELVAVALAL